MALISHRLLLLMSTGPNWTATGVNLLFSTNSESKGFFFFTPLPPFFSPPPPPPPPRSFFPAQGKRYLPRESMFASKRQFVFGPSLWGQRLCGGWFGIRSSSGCDLQKERLAAFVKPTPIHPAGRCLGQMNEQRCVGRRKIDGMKVGVGLGCGAELLSQDIT